MGTNPPGARYCSDCGTALRGAGAHVGGAGLRAVTVLFCDIVDSTALSHRVGPEELTAVFHGFRKLTRRLAAEHAVRRVRFIGDAARIVFGPPDAREDGPELALRCGLALVQEIAGLSSVANGPLDARVGIAHGTVVLSDEIEETSTTEEAVVGSVPALAARLAAFAPTGAVVVDAATRRLVGERFAFRDLGLARLKGFDEPERAWQVEHENPFVSRHAARRMGGFGAARVVGRDAEAGRLFDAWHRAREGRTEVVVLSGDPGLGKSTLADMAAAAVAAHGALRLDLDCTPRTTRSPLYPVAAMLGRLAGSAGPLTDETLEGWLEHQVPEAAGSSGDAASAEFVRERRLGMILALIRRLATRQPLVVVVEDVQWADPSTVHLLGRLRAAQPPLPLMMIVTARPEAAILLEHDDRIELEVLGDADARALVHALCRAAGEVLPAETMTWIIERGEGVPLYLEELTRSAIEARGDLPSTLPASLQHVIQARLERRPALRNLVQAASVIGRECSLPLLADIAGQPMADLRQAAARLIDDGVLSGADGGDLLKVRFKHALIHDAVYATLLRGERDRLHLAAAASLGARVGATPDATADVVAYHLRAARRHADAAVWYLRAAAQTHDSAAYREAIDHAEQGHAALAAHGATDAALRRVQRQLLVCQGMALCATEGYSSPSVARAYGQARELGTTGDPAEDYPVDRGIATYHLVKGDVELAYQLSRRALEVAAQSKLPEHHIDALSVHGYTSVYTAHLAEAREVLHECLKRYREEGGQRLRYPVPQDAAAAAWALLPTAEWLLGLPAEAEASIASGLAHVAADGDRRPARPFDRVLVHAWVAGTRLTQRREADALHHAGIARELSLRYGYRDWLAVSTLVGQIAQAILEPSVDAVAAVQQTLTQAAASGATLNAPYYLWGLARALLRLGATDAAQAVVSQALQAAAATGEHRMDSELMLLLHEMAPDAPGAPERLRAAFTLALSQQAVTTALRIGLRAEGATADLRALDAGELTAAAIAARTRELEQHWPLGA